MSDSSYLCDSANFDILQKIIMGENKFHVKFHEISLNFIVFAICEISSEISNQLQNEISLQLHWNCSEIALKL